MERDDPSPMSPELQAYVLRALQVEVYELRKELHQDYLNEAQLMNDFVPRGVLRDQARIRREWPLILAAVVTTIGQLVTMIVVLRGGR